MMSTVSPSGSARRPNTVTCAPSAANNSAVARPMPLPPPAMTATLPSSIPIGGPLSRAVGGIAATEAPHRARVASRSASRAPGGAEVHEGLIVVIRAAFRHQGVRQIPHGLLAPEASGPALPEEDAAEHATDIRVDDGGVTSIGEREDRARRVPTDAFHAQER